MVFTIKEDDQYECLFFFSQYHTSFGLVLKLVLSPSPTYDFAGVLF
jgi:hypothetical protein